MASLDDVSTDDLRQVLAEVGGKKADTAGYDGDQLP